MLLLPAFMLKGLCVSKKELDVYEENYLQTFSSCRWPLAETNFLDLFSRLSLSVFLPPVATEVISLTPLPSLA